MTSQSAGRDEAAINVIAWLAIGAHDSMAKRHRTVFM